MIRKTRIIGTIFAIFYFCVFLSFMTKAEQPQMRRKIPFPKMDINGDGKISRKEFPGPKIAFNRLDKDRNGFLTLEELRQADAVKQSNIDDKKSSQSNRITIDVHDHLVGRTSNDFKQSIREALSQMNQHGVKKMFIMPPPFYPEHPALYQYSEFLDVIRKHSDRFAFLGGGGILNVMIQQALKNGKVDATMKRTFTRKAEKIIKDGAIGFGEMTTEHLCLGPRHNHQEAPPDHPLFLLLADIAASHDIPIDIHMEAVPKKMKVPEHLSRFSANPRILTPNIEAFERLLKHNKKAKIVWSHCGWDNTSKRTVELDRMLLEKHPNLYVSFKICYKDSTSDYQPIDKHGEFKQKWLDLLKDFPDRFMIGSDQFFERSRQKKFPPSFKETQDILSLLPDDLARKIGYENAIKIFNLKKN